MQPISDEGIPRIRWQYLEPAFLRAWKQGEHMALIGPTGQGKTTLALDLLSQRADLMGANVIVMASKQRDSQLEALLKTGQWALVRDWPPTYEQRTKRRIVFWPKYTKASSSAKTNRPKYLKALDGALEEQNWTVYLDEVIYFIEQLRLKTVLDEYWNTGRSSGMTLVASSQGATWVPRAMMTQQSWLVSFHVKDADVQRRVAEIAGDRARYVPAIQSLRNHEFLLVETLTSDAYISRVGT